MDKIHNLLSRLQQPYDQYESLDEGDDNHILEEQNALPACHNDGAKFAWLEYVSFFTIGMSMMWVWLVAKSTSGVEWLKLIFEPGL
jgi:hypothetical protein